MTIGNDPLAHLEQRLQQLSAKQNYLAKEIESLQGELKAQRGSVNQSAQPETTSKQESTQPAFAAVPSVTYTPPIIPSYQTPLPNPVKPTSTNAFDWEKFLGENLVNKIGIAITVIGISIGAKYAIEHNLINPLTRIIIGFLFSLGLLGFGIKLKKNYLNYSAVLVSGAMAIMFFLCYLAHAHFGIIPREMAFIAMLLITSATVYAALNYEQQVIAIIGLVGAYAIPILLSDGSGKIALLFSYITIVNAGILYLSFKKDWLPLLYTSFGLSWIILLSWFVSKYEPETDLWIALTFGGLFFVSFYLTLLGNRLVKNTEFEAPEIALILVNSFLPFIIGYSAINQVEAAKPFLGLYTLSSALVHLFVSLYLQKKDGVDSKLKYLINGLVLVFLTLTIPIQLEGHWITSMWIMEAVLLIWIGRTKKSLIYEWISYPVLALALVSQLQDWITLDSVRGLYDDHKNHYPFINLFFVNTVIVVFGFYLFAWILGKYKSADENSNHYPIQLVVQRTFVVLLYIGLLIEIYRVFDCWVVNWSLDAISNDTYLTIKDYKDLSFVVYTFAFIGGLTWFVKNKALLNQEISALKILNCLGIGLFLIFGLYSLSELREDWLRSAGPEQVSVLAIFIRYPVIILFLLFGLNFNQFISLDIVKAKEKDLKLLIVHAVIVWLLSSELLSWLSLAGVKSTYKLGLSLLWGAYALSLVAYGISRNYRILRIGAMSLFGLTLIKLFLYDISRLSTLSKTIVFVTLGVILLIVSFLYNKYKDRMNTIDETLA